MQDISVHVYEKRAVATLTDSLGDRETPYQMHPSTIDSAFQLYICAAFNGVGRLFTKLSVPTYMEELYISPAKEAITIQADGTSFGSGSLLGDLMGVSAGKTVMAVKGLRMAPLGDNDESLNDDPHAAVELVWKCNVNLLDETQLMRPSEVSRKSQRLIEKLALACMIESNCQLLNVSTTQLHLEKFRDWLRTRQALAVENRYPEVPECASIAGMNSDTRVKFIEDVLAEAGETDAAAFAIAIHRIYQHSTEIFDGTTDPLDVLMKDNILTKLYDTIALRDDAEFFELLGHYTPSMKILEIGAGTGGTTSTILPHLTSAYGERMFGSYTYTDISAGFFVQAKERFKAFQGIEFSVLDISQEPVAQGFEAESFDLIVATNVLHATPSLHQTLSNVRKLLHPRGRLVLQELDPVTKWINYVMGVLPGWWLGAGDERPVEPYVDAERWIKEMKAAGFAENPSIKHDGYFHNSIVAKPAVEEKLKKVAVLRVEKASPRTEAFVRSLAEEGYELDFCTIEQTPRAGQDIISLLDVESAFLVSATEAGFAAFKGFIARCQNSGLLWITEASQIECRDPNYSLVLGMARTLRNELGMDFATCELESFENADSLSAAIKVLSEFGLRTRDANIDPNMEYAYADGRVQISRFHSIKVSKQLEAVT